MKKKKKENKKNIDAKAVASLLSRRKWSKINDFMVEGKVTKEGVEKYLAEKPLAALEAFKYNLKIVENYPFSDFYPTLEDYFNSDLCIVLHKETDDNAIRCWINMFPSNSEELLSLYDRLDESAKDRMLTFCTYRTRYIAANPSIRLNYLNCFEGLFQLVSKRLDINPNDNFKSDIASILDFMFRYSIYFNESWLDKAAEKYLRARGETRGGDTVKDVKDRYFHCRLNTLSSYYQSMLVIYTHEEELNFIFDRIIKKEGFESCEMRMLEVLYLAKVVCSDLKSNFKSYGRVEEIGKRLEKRVYKEFLRPVFDKSISSINLDAAPPNFQRAIELVLENKNGRYFELEKDERHLDFVFSMACKRYCSSPYQLMRLVSKPDSLITKYMHNTSIIFASNMGEVLYTDDLTSAKEILEIQRKVVFVVYNSNDLITPPFQIENYSYRKHFRIEKLSDDEFAKIAKYINWNYINKYSEDDNFIDYDFAVKNFDYFGKENAYLIGGMIEALSTASDAMKFADFAIENCGLELGPQTKDVFENSLERRFQHKRDKITAEEIAKLISEYKVKIPYGDWFGSMRLGADYGASSDQTLFNSKLKVSDILKNL